MGSSSHLLALDLGTSSVRALIVDAGGRVLGRAQQRLAIAFPSPGRVEQDPLEMWQRSVEVMRAALADSGVDASELAALGVVAQRSTALAWDAQTHEPLGPAIGWQDRRTSERVAELVAIGLPLNTMATCTKYEWWIRHSDAVREAARRKTLRLGTPDVWLTDRLTGGAAHVTDVSNAGGTGLLNLESGEWLPMALELFGVESDWLPELVSTSAVVGVTDAALLGAPVPVAARAGDQQAASFAQGVRAQGQAKLTLGTSGMLDLHTGDRPALAPPGCYPLPLWEIAGQTAFCLEATVVSAGAAIEWLVDLGLLASVEVVDEVAGQVQSSEGVVFVPALQGLGTPFLDSAARGAWFGLTRGSQRPHLVRSVLEGIAQRCVDVVEALGVTQALRVDGGLARSDRLLQALADLSGLEMLRAAEVETTALGAALLAGIAVGLVAEAPSERDSQALPAAAPVSFRPDSSADWRQQARQEWKQALERTRS